MMSLGIAWSVALNSERYSEYIFTIDTFRLEDFDYENKWNSESGGDKSEKRERGMHVEK